MSRSRAKAEYLTIFHIESSITATYPDTISRHPGIDSRNLVFSILPSVLVPSMVSYLLEIPKLLPPNLAMVTLYSVSANHHLGKHTTTKRLSSLFSIDSKRRMRFKFFHSISSAMPVDFDSLLLPLTR